MTELTFDITQLLSILLAAIAIGLLVAWQIRGHRIRGMQKVLCMYKDRLLHTEMEYGNLKAYLDHLKSEKKELRESLQVLKNNFLKQKEIQELSESKKQSIERQLDRLKEKVIFSESKISDLHVNVETFYQKKNGSLRRKEAFNDQCFSTLAKESEAIKNFRDQIDLLKKEINPRKITAVRPQKKLEVETNNRHKIIERIHERAGELDWVKIGPAYSKDDLKQLQGLGAFVEKKFNAIGISSIAQLASLEEREQEQLNALLELPMQKIQQEKWSKQSKKILGLKMDASPLFLLRKIAAKNYLLSRLQIGRGTMENADDLLLINTLTPIDIAKLNAFGIYKISQIARLNKTAIVTITEVLDLLEHRVENEYWVEQANDILAGKISPINRTILRKKTTRKSVY